MDERSGRVVADQLRAAPPDPEVMAAIHGSVEPDEIAAQIVGVLSALELFQPVTRCLFHEASVGSVTGIALADGTEVVVKAYQPAWSADFLQGVIATQDQLWHAGLPCGRPIGGPTRSGHGFATVETFLADPGRPDAFGDAERTASAEGLAFIVRSADLDQRLVRYPRRPGAGDLYPEPHSPLFDFGATGEGAEWIDELARLAKAAEPSARTVVAHTDWSARNVRLGARGVRAVYDLDSLAAIDLSTAVGHAAVNWRALGVADEPVAPDIDEVSDWLDRFPIPLSKAERRAALAAALFSHCYTARCEHAIDPNGHRNLRARPRLREDAARYRQALNG